MLVLSVVKAQQDQNFSGYSSNVNKDNEWFKISSSEGVATPSLAVYPARISSNIRKMVSMLDGVEQLCPHVKTHKSSDILQRLLNCGIAKFKCATLSELLMVASTDGVEFALLAMQPIGPHVRAFVDLVARFPSVCVSTIVDNAVTVRQLAQAADEKNVIVEVLVDINNGMNRTGIECGESAVELYRSISSFKQLRAGGLHVYDGHIHDPSLAVRTERVESAMQPVLELREAIEAAGCGVPRLLAGGTPSFPIHAQHKDRICCPGTPVLWDAGYGQNFGDLDFLPAATLLTRVVSKVGDDRYCLDLGYKAIASEMNGRRGEFLKANVVDEVSHSEEHLVVQVENSPLEIGQLLYVVPRHICPTVARHSHLLVVEDGGLAGKWLVTARDRLVVLE